MVLGTELMHGIDKDFGMIWVHKLVYTVAKVEDMTCTRPVPFKNTAHFSTNSVSRRV